MKFGSVLLNRTRVTCALAVIIAAVFASIPWRPLSVWCVGIAAIVLIILFAQREGVPVTTLLRRRWDLENRRASNERVDPVSPSSHDDRVAALIRVIPHEAPATTNWLPLTVLASYLDRYGVRCSSVRVAYHHTEHEQEAWITLVVDAADNLAALAARGSHLPLKELAEAARRRLTAHLREEGYRAEYASTAPTPVVSGVEGWNGIRVDPAHSLSVGLGEERVAAYSVLRASDFDEKLLGEKLDAIASYPANETWSVVEFTGTPENYVSSLTCAIRKPGIVELLPKGMRPLRGVHVPALTTLAPESSSLISVH